MDLRHRGGRDPARELVVSEYARYGELRDARHGAFVVCGNVWACHLEIREDDADPRQGNEQARSHRGSSRVVLRFCFGGDAHFRAFLDRGDTPRRFVKQFLNRENTYRKNLRVHIGALYGF